MTIGKRDVQPGDVIQFRTYQKTYAYDGVKEVWVNVVVCSDPNSQGELTVKFKDGSFRTIRREEWR